MPWLTAPLLVLALAIQPGQYDTVVLTNGGVLRGTIVENVPEGDLVLQMPDGTIRRIPPADVSEVYYAPIQPAAPPPEAPPEPPSPDLSEVRQWQLALAIGVDFPLGTLDGTGLPLASAVSVQLSLTFEGAYRVIEPLEVGAYMRLAGGSAQPSLNDLCVDAGGWCDTFDFGIGPLVRWSFLPRAPMNPWVAVGGGFEWLSIWDGPYGLALDYSGWEVIGSAGLDWRLSPWAGVGIFVSGRWGWFQSLSVSGGLPVAWAGAAPHGWFSFGVRSVFGP